MTNNFNLLFNPVYSHERGFYERPRKRFYEISKKI